MATLLAICHMITQAELHGNLFNLFTKISLKKGGFVVSEERPIILPNNKI